MRKVKHKIFLICLAGLFLILVGCGGKEKQSENQADKSSEEDFTVIGVSQIGSESVWRTANTTSIQETFTKEKGYLLLFDNARQKQENQMKALRSFISQRVDYIIFSPIVEDGWDTVLQEAKEAGIPVILMDRKVKVEDESLYTCWVGSDFEEEGINAGKWLEEYLQGKMKSNQEINIVILQGTQGSTAMEGRTKGFDTIAEEHENWNILEIQDADFTTTKGKEVMHHFLQEYENIDVLVSQNDDMTFGALDAIEEAGKKAGTGGDIAVISFDGTKSALEKVKSGRINVDIECNPLQGPYIEEIIQKLEKNESVEKNYYVEEKVFTQKNVMSVLKDRKY